MKTALKILTAAAVLMSAESALANDMHKHKYNRDYDRNAADYNNNTGYNPSSGYYSDNGTGSSVNGAPATTGQRYSYYNDRNRDNYGNSYLGMRVDSWQFPGETMTTAVKHSH